MVSSPASGVPDVRFWAEQGGMLLKQARHAARMRQKELAGMSGTSRTTLSAYEHGRSRPRWRPPGASWTRPGSGWRLRPRWGSPPGSRDGRPFPVPGRLPRLDGDGRWATCASAAGSMIWPIAGTAGTPTSCC